MAKKPKSSDDGLSRSVTHLRFIAFFSWRWITTLKLQVLRD